MKTRFHIFSLIITLGMLLISNGSFACGVKSGKSCCKTEASTKKEMKDCCKKKQDSEKSKPCGGKCGHSNCTTSAPSSSFILNNDVKFISYSFAFSPEKQKFYHNETNTSNGFFTLWLIPKIS